MPDFLQTTVDKFTFRVATDRLYSPGGLWARWSGGEGDGRVRIGLSDFLQQHSGDVAFVEVAPVGTRVRAGDEIGTIETVKVNVSLASPVDGTVVEVNPELATAPEVINQDPYGGGWLAIVAVEDREAQEARLLTPDAWFARMKAQAEQEAREP
jgi:glycine cleavage system H protein